MSQVNPPYLIKKLRPRGGLNDELGQDVGRTFNNYLDQLERVLDQLYRRTGGSSDSVANPPQNLDNAAKVDLLEKQMADDPFTVDSTGFTVDSTMISADWSQA